MQTLFGMEIIKVPLFKQVQARRHRKKRINKKWLKRYGTKIIQIRPKSESDEYLVGMGKIFVPEELWDVFQKQLYSLRKG
jgi:hypothetical protein